jgi:glycosyltransferase involved in cell wall biosynthesis
MSVSRTHQYLDRCIESITRQEYKHLEFLICLDTNEPGIREKLETICGNDQRVKIFQNARQMGLAFSLNKLLRHSAGELIIRMDDDDIASENRLNILVDAHVQYPKSLIIGSFAESMKISGKIISVPTSPSEIKNLSVEKTRFLHPTVSFKRKFFCLVGFYDTDFVRLQDKDLWERACLLGVECRNIPCNLLNYNDFHSTKTFKILFWRWRSKLLFYRKFGIKNSLTNLMKTILIDLYWKIR